MAIFVVAIVYYTAIIATFIPGARATEETAEARFSRNFNNFRLLLMESATRLQHVVSSSQLISSEGVAGGTNSLFWRAFQ